jgi:hypothetical protein
MNVLKVLGSSSRSKRRGRRRRPSNRPPYRPRLEGLEDRTAPSITLQGIPEWKPQGPAPIYEVADQPAYVDGAINAIAVEPGNADNKADDIYIGSVNGGVWHSVWPTTPGTAPPSWKPLTDFLPSLSIGTLAFSPLNHGVLFAGTPGFTSFTGLNDPAVGLFRTTDGGANWSHVGQGLPANTEGDVTGDTAPIYKIVPTDFTDPSTLQEVVLVATERGIFRSIDGGDHFAPVLDQAGQVIDSPTTDLVPFSATY